MNTNFRLAKEEDLKTLAQVYIEAYNSIDIGETWDVSSALELMKYMFEDQSDLFFVLEVDGKAVGAIVASVRPWWDGNHLIEGELFIHPSYQHLGLGKKLIKQLFTEAQEKYGVVTWDTYTHRVHEHPLKWYQKLGFEEIENWVMITGDVKKVLENLKDA
ncbi:MAG: GNAT family N-acetyltransferase [Candidatus Woykebacteria bacterium]